MKLLKILSIAVAAALSITATSCLGDDDSSTSQTITVSCYNRIIDADGDLLLNAANYVYEFDLTNGYVSIKTYDADISSVAYIITDVPLSATYDMGYTFSASSPTVTNTSGTELSSVAVTNFYGQFAGNTIKCQYTVNGYTVVYCSPIEDYMAYSTTTTTPNDGGDSFVWTSAAYDITYSVANQTADMTITTIKFSDDQPYSLSEMVIEDLNVEPLTNGLLISADAVTPKIGDVEYPDYELTNVKAYIYPNFSSTKYFLGEYMTMSFECYDSQVSVTAYTFEQ